MKRVEILSLLLLVVVIIASVELQSHLFPRKRVPSFSRQLCTPQTPDMKAANDLTSSRNPSGAYYEEQLWLGLTDAYTSMTFNVTAVSQEDSFGFGPAYLLNGLTDKNYWYQVGIEWNGGSFDGTSHRSGFNMVYQVWSGTTHKSVYPGPGVSGLTDFSKPVTSGDIVQLSLSFVGGEVLMAAHDLNSGGNASALYPSFDGTTFLPARRNSALPTSLLTEWDHVLPYFCSDQVVVFSSSKQLGSAAILQIDEWNFTGYPPSQWANASLPHQRLFNSGRSLEVLSNPLTALDANGTIIYANLTNFYTM